VEEVYGSDFAEYEAFEEALDVSLEPRGFDLLFDLVAELDLPPGSLALDVGAREAYHSIELARRFARPNLWVAQCPTRVDSRAGWVLDEQEGRLARGPLRGWGWLARGWAGCCVAGVGPTRVGADGSRRPASACPCSLVA
jgi:hypothetical protein